MNNNATATVTTNESNGSSFFARVLENEALKRGVAAAAAGALIAVVTEAIWPSDA